MPQTRQSTTSILIVHEDPSVLIFLGRFLEQNGMRALFARNAGEAVEIASRTYIPIDVILSGISNGLPEWSGADVISRVRGLRPGVVALRISARTDHEVIRVDALDGQTAGTLFDSISSVIATAEAPGFLRYPYQ